MLDSLLLELSLQSLLVLEELRHLTVLNLVDLAKLHRLDYCCPHVADMEEVQEIRRLVPLHQTEEQVELEDLEELAVDGAGTDPTVETSAAKGPMVRAGVSLQVTQRITHFLMHLSDAGLAQVVLVEWASIQATHRLATRHSLARGMGREEAPIITEMAEADSLCCESGDISLNRVKGM